MIGRGFWIGSEKNYYSKNKRDETNHYNSRNMVVEQVHETGRNGTGVTLICIIIIIIIMIMIPKRDDGITNTSTNINT